MFKQALIKIILGSLLIFSTASFADQQFTYQFGTSSKWNPTWQTPSEAAVPPPNCTLQGPLTANYFKYICTQPVQQPFLFDTTVGQTLLLFSCWADAPNSGKIIYIDNPRACLCTIEPGGSPCPN